MKTLLLAGIATLALYTSAGGAVPDEDWRMSFRTCRVDIQPRDGSVTLEPADLDKLKEAVDFLKKCNKFWNCVAHRGEKGHAKHCYYPKTRISTCVLFYGEAACKHE